MTHISAIDLLNLLCENIPLHTSYPPLIILKPVAGWGLK